MIVGVSKYTAVAKSDSVLLSNSPLDCMSRLETCALLSGVDMPLHALRSQVANAIEVVVQTARLMDGSRKIVSVAEVLPLVDGQYRVQELMKYYSHGLDEDGKLMGLLPGHVVKHRYGKRKVAEALTPRTPAIAPTRSWMRA